MGRSAGVKFRVFIFILVVTCVWIFGTVEIYAQETGVIQMNCKGTGRNQNEIIFQGAKFVLYKVAQPAENSWERTEEFKQTEIPLSPSDAAGQRESARLLWEYVEDTNLPGMKRESDKNGNVVFSHLEEGIYLIGQAEKYPAEEGFFVFAPFLVTIPSTENGMPLYEIDINPKSEWEGTPEKPTEQKLQDDKHEDGVETGDVVNPAVYCLLALLSLTVITAYEKRR